MLYFILTTVILIKLDFIMINSKYFPFINIFIINLNINLIIILIIYLFIIISMYYKYFLNE